MRLSVDKNDAGYVWNEKGIVPNGVEVLLDGKPVDPKTGVVITADEEAGYLVQYDRDERGRLKLGNDHLALRRKVEGKVELFLVATEGVWLHSIPRPESLRMRANELTPALVVEKGPEAAVAADPWAKHLRF